MISRVRSLDRNNVSQGIIGLLFLGYQAWNHLAKVTLCNLITRHSISNYKLHLLELASLSQSNERKLKISK